MKRTTIAACMALMVAAGSVTGCSSQTGTNESSTTAQDSAAGTEALQSDAAGNKTDGVTITFWHSMGGVNGEAINMLVEQFNKENTAGITVEAQYQGSYDDAINKLKSAQIGNMGADLVQIYDIGTRFMIDSGWVVPMQDLIDGEGWDLSQVEPNIAAYYTVDDILYSMPFNSSTPILYYNRDMFEKAGITEVPDSLLTKGGAGEVISLGIYGWFFEQFTSKQGADYADNGNGRSAAATAVAFDKNGAGVKTLTAWKALADQGYAPNVGRGGDAGLADFSAGKAAMTLGSTASLKQILNDVNGKFEVGTAYFPKVSDEDQGGVSIGGGSLWALNNEDPERQNAVWQFVKFLVSPASQAYWNSQTGYFPVTLAAHEEPVFKENIEKYPQFQTAIDQLHDSTPQSAGALLSIFPEARQIVETEIENMMNNGTSPEDTVIKMAESINKSIEDYNLLNE
ncbi:ABC transporter substrate-binding protein [Hungatella sp. SL.1.14]|uniref:ABC transporter substrate-binding protein n=1 Tax=Hungatella sp. SL.1.14 TaxID=2963703 RepID=UPI00210AD3BD|nr:ABC transporter substrate-binding protein [Hungatella sp. SL.1.14]MCQ4827545.1 ABC transporter substrate-binding protein [Hungatella sp. SL.1.14]